MTTYRTVEGHENDCGRTGINGGFIANPAVRFGANCFGYKPKITSEEQDAMDSAPEYPKTRKDMVFERRVDYWRQKLPEVTVAPFNKSVLGVKYKIIKLIIINYFILRVRFLVFFFFFFLLYFLL